MAPGFSKYTVLVMVTIVVGFFITWDLNNRQVEMVLQTGAGTDEAEYVPDDASEVVIPVSGMTCRSCEMAIEGALEGIDGVYQVDASHLKKSVVARYDPERISISRLKSEIEKVGYTAGDPGEE